MWKSCLRFPCQTEIPNLWLITDTNTRRWFSLFTKSAIFWDWLIIRFVLEIWNVLWYCMKFGKKEKKGWTGFSPKRSVRLKRNCGGVRWRLRWCKECSTTLLTNSCAIPGTFRPSPPSTCPGLFVAQTVTHFLIIKTYRTSFLRQKEWFFFDRMVGRFVERLGKRFRYLGPTLPHPLLNGSEINFLR